ncbi:MAG: transcriptional regulator GcvA [Burkholderiales bacterium]|nr:transcriptional regulator GcvA [Burkholderiales bacterium]
MRRRHYDLPPLDQLEAFDAAARHLSFTRAADELALTQSAVSRQIAAIEQHYGSPLFRRLHRALRLTDDGQALHRVVAAALAQLHAAGEALRRRTRKKTVVVTTTPGFAGLWLIPRLAEFTARHPDVEVHILSNLSLVQLDRDGVDVAVRYRAQAGNDDGGIPLFDESVIPVCSPALMRDAARPLKTPPDLARHTLLVGEGHADSHMTDWPLWLRAMGVEGLQPAGTMQFSQYDQLIQSAIAGQGVALGRVPLVNGEIKAGRLVAPFRRSVASPRSYFLLQSTAAARKAGVAEFVAWLLAQAGTAAVSGSPSGGPAATAAPAARARPTRRRPPARPRPPA